MTDKVLEALLGSMADAQEQPYFRALIYGAEGCGKTVSACTVGKPRVPGKKHVLLIETDPEGYISLLNHPELYRVVQRMEYQGVSQIEAVAQYCNTEQFAQYDTIIIDTVNQMVNQDLDTITKSRMAKGKIDEEVPDWPAYRLNGDRVRRAITTLVKNADKHVILTSHSRSRQNKLGISITSPDMPDGVRGELTRLMHLVGYMTAEVSSGNDGTPNYNRKMQVHPTKTIVAKSRVGGLPVVLTNPNLGSLVNGWLENGANVIDATTIAPESQGLNATPVSSPNDEPSDGDLSI